VVRVRHEAFSGVALVPLFLVVLPVIELHVKQVFILVLVAVWGVFKHGGKKVFISHYDRLQRLEESSDRGAMTR
jgi:hypothetical protein